MARKSASSVDVIAATPLRNGPGGYETKTISIRPIDNGFVCCETHSKDDGSYSSSERYYPERPKVSESAGQNSGTVGNESLAGAHAALK